MRLKKGAVYDIVFNEVVGVLMGIGIYFGDGSHIIYEWLLEKKEKSLEAMYNDKVFHF